MLADVVQLLLIALTIISAVLSIEVKNLYKAVIFFALMSISIGAIFWLLNSPYLAVFQLTVYSGAVVALLLAVVMLTVGKEREMK
ncbi:MAG: NADH-quinone oxidoreductase subunit J [Thaumarchaeota archaeon]|nr:NADH-quinone oxidoreductase subunit J [Nitrososphaerota archaeon]